MKQRSLIHWLALTSLILTGSAAFSADNITGLIGTRARGMSAFRAVATGSDALYFNPAGLGQLKRFAIGADYLYRFESKEHLAGGSLTDGSSGILAAGLDFHANVDQGNQNRTDYFGTFGLAYEMFPDTFWVGASLKYTYMLATNTDPKISAFTGDAGLLLRLPMGLSLAAVGYNLIPSESSRLPLSVGAGAAWTYCGSPTGNDPAAAIGSLTLAVDYLALDLAESTRQIRHEISAGAEVAPVDFAFFRAGYTYAITEEHHSVSGGLTLLLDSFQIDGMYHQNISHTDRRSFGVAVKYYL